MENETSQDPPQHTSLSHPRGAGGQDTKPSPRLVPLETVYITAAFIYILLKKKKRQKKKLDAIAE